MQEDKVNRFSEAARSSAGFDAFQAPTAELRWIFPDGSFRSEIVPIAVAGVGGASSDTSGNSSTAVASLRVDAAKVRASGAAQLRVIPSFGHAAKGEPGWWFSPYGHYGEWDRDEGRFFADDDRMIMPMFGWATPKGAFLAIVTRLKCYPKLLVEVTGGRYCVSCVLDGELCTEPYEDFEIEYHLFPSGTGYAALARRYREYQLSRGAVRPLRERVLDNPALKYAVEAPEIRIRQAWKPVPSPVPYQQPENEPEPRVAVTFDRVADISRALKAAGVEKAELCLVGWNIGGHDGRWPQSFPSEPRLGGDARLRAAIAAVKADGYQIVPHGNFRDAYTIADSWDGEWVAKEGTGGEIEPDRGGGITWGGGLAHIVCPQRAYERFCSKDIPRMAAFGFRGIGYFDVVSILHAPICRDPRHPCNRAQSARFWGLSAEISKRELGGFGSEGGVDHFAGSLDSVLYASFDSPLKVEKGEIPARSLACRMIPMFQLVYNGIIVQNPYTETINYPLKDRYWQLKFLECGGRPAFYFYSQFRADGAHWMGMTDLTCATDEELSAAVAKVAEGCGMWRPFARLQYEFMDGHEMLAPGVFMTTWSDGTRLVVNYGKEPFELEGRRVVSPLDFVLLEP